MSTFGQNSLNLVYNGRANLIKCKPIHGFLARLVLCLLRKNVFELVKVGLLLFRFHICFVIQGLSLFDNNSLEFGYLFKLYRREIRFFVKKVASLLLLHFLYIVMCFPHVSVRSRNSFQCRACIIILTVITTENAACYRRNPGLNHQSILGTYVTLYCHYLGKNSYSRCTRG